MTPAEKLIELSKNFLDYLYNNIETIYGLENDNEHQPVTIPASFQATCYGLWNSKCTGVDFSASWWHNGNWNIMYSYDVSFINGNLNYDGFNEIGRFNKSDWDAISTIPEWGVSPDSAYNILHTYISENNQMYIMSTESENLPYGIIYTIDDQYNLPKISFDKNNSVGSVYSKYQAGDGDLPDISPTGTLFSAQYVNIGFWDFDISVDSDGYVSATTELNIIPTTYNWARFNDAVMVTRTDNQNFINNDITNNGAEHNYTYTYETENGDEVTAYYNDTEITYDDNYNIINKIGDDTGIDFDIPTYHEKKYGPPVDPDADIEVDMPVQEAAFGDGLTHYYVCNKGAGVLEDISAAMSTWDIKNTGKDLYKNLLSCRLTKIGGIPAENSTFVIYGEELLYNGSPISINKITGNPTIDLGEYEILPKFNDFRDYAPYTKIEMFIPYCGWVGLPSHCMSSEDAQKIISGTIVTDIIAATCKAIIKCNDTVVAEAAGVTAIDIPFVGENVGMKLAGIANSIVSYGKTASGAVGTIAGGLSGGGASGGAAAAGALVNMVGSMAQMEMAMNANYTEICGKTGDGCNIAGLGSVYIKIQRPKTGGFPAPDYVPDDYGHITGFICMQKLRIGDQTGFIRCDNPDLSGITGATKRELEEIKRLLESGIIVEHPE